MGNQNDDAPDVALHPPSLYLTAILAGFTIRAFAGGAAPGPRLAGEGVGIILLLGAVIILNSALSAFAETGEALKPSTPSQELIKSGFYQYSRNPIYLAMTLFGLGLGFLTMNIWMVLTTLGTAALIDRLVIRPEEAYLSRRFGAEYEDYKRRVRRWL